GLDPAKVHVELEPLDHGDSHAAFSEYLRQVLRAVLALPPQDDRLRQQIELCNQLLHLLRTAGGEEIDAQAISVTGQRLLSVRQRLPGHKDWERPDTPLALGCLLTGTRRDPSLASQLRKEIQAANRVDIVCSFIEWSGRRSPLQKVS